MSVCEVEAPAHSTASTEPPRSPEEEARDILATAAKNQAEDGPSTRRAAIRACKYLREQPALVLNAQQMGSLLEVLPRNSAGMGGAWSRPLPMKSVPAWQEVPGKADGRIVPQTHHHTTQRKGAIWVRHIQAG